MKLKNKCEVGSCPNKRYNTFVGKSGLEYQVCKKHCKIRIKRIEIGITK